VLIVAVLLIPTGASAQTAAGTSIGNQASATYTDSSSVSRTATSNVVTTVVQQVASLTLTANGAKTASPGGPVFYPHTLTNTGNGSDSFTLSLAPAQSGAFTLTGTAIYLDANGDGIPDNFTNLNGTSVTVTPGAVNAFKFVITGTVPSGATAGQTNNFSVTGTSVFDPTKTAANTDVTTVTSNAVINLNKVMSANSGASPSGPYTVTLTYTNSGNVTGTTVNIGDALPAGMTYVAGSGRWSVTGVTALTDATGDLQPAAGTPHIDYSAAGNTVTAIVDQVAAGVSGQLTFSVNIAAGVAPGVLTNTASISYNDGSGSTVNGTSNGFNFTVLQSAAVTISDTGVAANDNDATINAIDTINSAAQGSIVTFTDVVKNTGNGTDSFDITIPSNTFPAGTVFTLYKSDGVTPLIDTNGNSIPDTGPLAAGVSYTVIVKAALPAGALGGPFNATATATSTVVGAINAGANASMTDRLVAITASTVDVTNNATIAGGGLGVGAGPEVAVIVNNATNPGTTTTFTLYANNTSAAAVADSYDLLASSTTTFGASSTLPAGWSVTFRSSLGADCTAANLGSVISNTGVVNGGTAKLYCAVISVPANYAAGAQAVYFQAKSPTSGALDIIHDQVTVNTVHNVTLTPNGSNQIFPGGSVVYTHLLTNNGNVSEAITFTNPITSDTLAGWSSVFYQDTNTNGTLDGADVAVSTATTFTLTPGQSVTMFVKVTAPAGAPVGSIDTTTPRAGYNATFATAQDQTTVIAGELRLVKDQALDANCDGVADTGFVQTNITVGAVPTACIIYRITATNAGTSNITGVSVSDATPAFTVYRNIPPASTTVGTIVAPTNGTAGTITATVGTLTPSQSAVIIFAVKIQ